MDATGVIDNESHRLTADPSNSPEDYTILEAAYQKNSKPDKSERTEIVRRVALSEKEVQVCEAFEPGE